MGNYLVIGGTSGIGAAVVKKLSEGGHAIHASYRSTDGAALPGVSYFRFDATSEDPESWAHLPPSLDGLVYCPGSILLKPFNRISTSELMKDYEIQVGGFLSVLRNCIRALKTSGTGSVVLFSSVAASVGMPFHAQVSATKGAIEGLTRALAAELAPTVRVNCIAPSLTDTRLAEALLSSPEKREASAQRHPMKRIGSAEDLAAATCFLLSPESSWTTGQIIHVDGGISTLR